MTREMSFDCGTFRRAQHALSYLDSGGEGPPLHFAHANGFPVSMYLPLLRRLAETFRVLGLSHPGQDGMGPWIRDWHPAAGNLVDFLEGAVDSPVVGVGHSIGGVVTLMAAVQRPDLFSGLVLLDPVLIPPRLVRTIALLKLTGQKARSPLAGRARRRRNGWRNREEALAYFRGKPLFHGWQEDYLRAYVTYGLKPSADGGVELVCPPEAEARGFENFPTDIWRYPKALSVPALIVRGETSDVLPQSSCERFCRQARQGSAAVIPGTNHFMPMQQPEAVIRIIKEFNDQRPVGP